MPYIGRTRYSVTMSTGAFSRKLKRNCFVLVVILVVISLWNISAITHQGSALKTDEQEIAPVKVGAAVPAPKVDSGEIKPLNK